MLKKLFVTVTATAAVAAGSLLAAPAQAAAPYPSSVVTVCKAKMKKDPVEANKHPKVKAKVTSGVAQEPTGKLRVTVKQPGPNFKKTVSYEGGKTTVKLPKRLPIGKKTVKVKFLPASGSIFKSCSTTTSLRVTA